MNSHSPSEHKNKNYSDSEPEEEKGGAHDEEQTNFERQDLFCVFTNERELKYIEQIKFKISQFTGIVIKTGTIGDLSLMNLLEAIEQDAHIFVQQNKEKQAQLLHNGNTKAVRLEMKGMDELFQTQQQTPSSGIIHLRFEEVSFTTKAVSVLKVFLTKKQLVETLVLSKVDFQQSINDFKDLVGGMQFSIKLRKVGITNMYFDDELHGKILCHLLNDCRTLREFDCSNCEFFHPKVFFDMCSAFIGDKCRVNILKMKGIAITQLEGKIIQFVMMKNKLLHTIDLSGCRVDSAENLEFFLQKLDKFSNIRCLTLDNILPDISPSLEILSEALQENTKLEVLIMRENKLKWVPYCNFWENLRSNTTLKKINVSKTDLSDRVLEKLCLLLDYPNISLVELDLSRNQISDVGLAQLGNSLCNNKSIKYLNLSQNNFRDIGLRNFVTYLSSPDCPLLELSLMGNKINNDGMKFLAEFLRPNTTLKMLDIGKNAFSDAGFVQFAQEMGANCTLSYLDISRNKELDDEGSLTLMAKALSQNKSLTTLDLSGLRIRKPFLQKHFEPALKYNCTLKYVTGKIPADIIDGELKTNILIENEVEPNFQKERQRGQQSFDVSAVDPENTSCLFMSGKDASLFQAALKYVMYRDIRQVDFSHMGLDDNNVFQIANYLAENPNLRSITLDGNRAITNDAIIRISSTLAKNNKLSHISFKDCQFLSNAGLTSLNEVLIAENTSLFSVELSEGRSIDPELSKSIRFQAQLNHAIQQHLKPVVRHIKQGSFRGLVQGTLNDRKTPALRSVEEVEFCKEATVSNYFSAAIKCWRIKQPMIIQIQDQSLQDQHIIELCNFLKDKNLITKLNLKRNKVTNLGAKVIANWINDHDQTLVTIDLSRNKITRAGGEALLASLKKSTRILDFQISYGNPIPLTTQLAIASEVIANNQIKQNQSEEKKSKVSQVAGRYELIDKGPNFMRCAIKSVELLRICHLSLPDNMLGQEEAKLIAAMIKMNPPLRTLNLEINNLDAECAKLIAEALKFNSNLAILNISKNKLSDLGVAFLLRPLIKARIGQNSSPEAVPTTQMIRQELNQSQSQSNGLLVGQVEPENGPSPLQVVSPNNLMRDSVPKLDPALYPASPASSNSASNSQRRNNNLNEHDLEQQVSNSERLKTEEIETGQLSQLKLVNITQNQTTVESLKSIWTLLEINPEVVLYFDSFQQEKIKVPLIDNHILSKKQGNKVAAEVNTQQISARADLFTERSLQDNSVVGLTFDEENHEYRNPQSKRQEIPISKRFISFFCCHKSETSTILPPTIIQVIQKLLTASKRKALSFKPDIQKYKNLERGSVQKPFQVVLITLHILLTPCAVIPIIMDTQTSCLLLAAYIGLLLISEFLFVLCCKTFAKFSLFNFYLYLQIVCGILRKVTIFGLAIFSGIGIKSRSLFGIIVGSIGFLSILIEQVFILSQLGKAKRVDPDAVHPNIESTQRLTELIHFNGLNLIYSQVTLMPSEDSLKTAELIAQELNPDLIKAKPVGLMPKLHHFFVNRVLANEAGKHILFIDIPLLVIGIICLAWSKLDITFVVIFALLACDTLACLLQHLRLESAINIDLETVGKISQQRIDVRAARYFEVLNRDVTFHEDKKAEDKHDLQDEESSIFETKGSEFNTIQDFEPMRAVKAAELLKATSNGLVKEEQLDGLVFEQNGQKAELTIIE